MWGVLLVWLSGSLTMDGVTSDQIDVRCVNSGLVDTPSTGASVCQIGEATSIRYNVHMDYEDLLPLHKISHSADKVGPYSIRDNEFRDHTRTFDPEAEAVIQSIKQKYNIQQESASTTTPST
jgi:hypothetical protein